MVSVSALRKLVQFCSRKSRPLEPVKLWVDTSTPAAPAAGYQQLSYTFTATAVSHEVQLGCCGVLGLWAFLKMRVLLG